MMIAHNVLLTQHAVLQMYGLNEGCSFRCPKDFNAEEKAGKQDGSPNTRSTSNIYNPLLSFPTWFPGVKGIVFYQKGVTGGLEHGWNVTISLAWFSMKNISHWVNILLKLQLAKLSKNIWSTSKKKILRCIDHAGAGENSPHKLRPCPLSLCICPRRDPCTLALLYVTGSDLDVQSGLICSFLTPHLHKKPDWFKNKTVIDDREEGLLIARLVLTLCR